MTIIEAATRYIALGWHPLPLRFGQKELRDKDGLTRPYVIEDFRESDNIGLCLIGARDKRAPKLVAIDFDAPEITPTAVWSFFPRTSGWGRESKPISQILYIAAFDRSVQLKDQGGKDPKRQTLVEIRATHQSMCPPSVHPNGERLEWLGDDITALAVEPKTLVRAANLVATYALMARYYPVSGARHYWGLYLAGLLHTLGLTIDEAIICFKLSGEFNHDTEIKDRIDATRGTYAKPDDDPLGGSQKLIDDMGAEVGDKFVRSLKKIWGTSTSGFSVGANGNVQGNTLGNVLIALRRLGITLAEDRFKQRMMITQGGVTVVLDDAAAIKVWLEVEREFQFRPAKDFFWDVLTNEARKAPFHPVRDYLNSLKWDGKPRVCEWLCRYGGALEDPLTKAVGMIALVAAVRRVRQPGVKFDELLIIESEQGTGKSSAMRALCPNVDWFSDDLPLNVDAKQIIERTSGRWIIEVSELVGRAKSDVDHLKASLSRQVDGPVRLAYARMPVEVPRQFIIVGTSNYSQYLRDMTGNRRFWPVEVDKFDLPAIERDRDQLWAEAAIREADGHSIRLDPSLYGAAAEAQELRRSTDPWEPLIEELIASTPVQNLPSNRLGQRISSKQLWDVLNVPTKEQDGPRGARIEAIMRRHGFKKVRVREGRQLFMGWGRDMRDGLFVPPDTKTAR